MITSFIAKYGIKNSTIQGFLLLVICLVLYTSLLKPNVSKDVRKFENKFKEKVEFLDNALNEFSNSINFGDNLDVIWDNTRKFRNLGYDYLVYNGDSLLYWTSNQVILPEHHFKNINPEVILLENGWFYKIGRQSGNFYMIGLFLIKKEYPYENQNLINAFNDDFGFNYDADVQKLQGDFNIKFPNNDFAFSLNNISSKKTSIIVEIILFFSFLGAIALIITGIWKGLNSYPKLSSQLKILFGILSPIFARYCVYWIDWKTYFPDFDLFDPNIFASSEITPTLGDLIINILVALALIELLKHPTQVFINKLGKNFTVGRILFVLSAILFFILSHLLIITIVAIIYNSNVALDLYNFMALTPISFVIILAFYMLLWSYFKISTAILSVDAYSTIPLGIRAATWFSTSSVYLIYALMYSEELLIIALFPLAFSFVLMLNVIMDPKKIKFSGVIVLLALFSMFLSIVLNQAQNNKELSAREIYAKKLISEKELETEIEYATTAELLGKSEMLVEFFKEPDLKKITEIKRTLERQYFQGYWSRYDIEFYFYDADTLPISTYIQVKDDPAQKFNNIIQNSGLESELSPNIFYVSDFSENLSYLVRQPIHDSTKNLGFIYLALRSKVIPQEIGFPRLLLNDMSNVFFKLEDYNMAKYVRGKLALRYGSFNYPLSIGTLLVDFQKKSGVIEDGDFVHLITHGEKNKTIILTKNRVDFQEYLTTFSFLFSVFGLLLIFTQIIGGKILEHWSSIKLAFRIQLLFIALVFFSLLFSGIGTGAYVKNQYLEYQEGQLREKVNSVQKEFYNKLEFEKNLNEASLGNYLEYLLNKYAAVFVTDVNLYNTQGSLLASSRPEIFNLGLLSTQMNARAYRNMNHKKLSLFVNEEFIGNQAYLSAYVPLINAQQDVIAYINLPYFAKQNDFENEIAGFLSAIVNIFVLLLTLSIVIAVFITGKIVDPLKKIQNSLSDFKLGKSQQPIEYKGNDEIGVLVQEYNTKLKELQESSEKLAKTEREMAWREMAKQVAHEIKNPLTPMKLRIQHFQRSFDPNADNADERIQKFSESLIEQIDALTNIANAFSNFAKMPKAQFEQVDLVKIMQTAVETFSAEENVFVECRSNVNTCVIEADKELLLRVFNNLIKNGIQAISPGSEGRIFVELNADQKGVQVRVTDNGIGIPHEMYDKIFVPNFTTKSTGTGLGLAMVKQIIESHQGEISFTSEPGQTVFSIKLPLKQ